MTNILISELFIAALALATWLWPYRHNWRVRLWMFEHPLRVAPIEYHRADVTGLSLELPTTWRLWEGNRQFIGTSHAQSQQNYQAAIGKPFSSPQDYQAWFGKQLVATDIKDGIDNA